MVRWCFSYLLFRGRELQSCLCSEVDSRRREAAAVHQGEQAQRARREAEAERRLAEEERRDRTAECLAWREKHRELADRFRAQEDLKALRTSKAVRRTPLSTQWRREESAFHACSPHSVKPTSRVTSSA